MTVPVFFIALRKAYGLGAQAMAAGQLHEPFFSVSWPDRRVRPDGARRCGPPRLSQRAGRDRERSGTQAAFDAMVAQSYAQGKALNVASVVELDSVIDPRDTRDWITRARSTIPAPPPRTGKKTDPRSNTW